ncbi:MAG: MarR family transcriptional regulator [Flavobacterium sp.]|nr:MarR family transcriptional regulator [Pedobacter sp.]
MKLEEEIASNNFESTHHKTLVNVLYTYGWVTNLIKKSFKKYAVTMQQFNILRILRGQHPNPATINLLKERMLDKMSDASRIVERLVQKGLVNRCTSLKDKRAVDIIINDKGLELLKSMDQEMTFHKKFKKNLSDEEADQLSGLLDKLRG